MIKKIVLGSVCLSAVLLAGCSTIPQNYQVFRDNSNDYLQADSLPPMKIPPGYSSNTVDSYYPVPHANKLSNKPPSLLPPNISSKDAPPEESWWLKYIPHAHMPWEAPENQGS